MTAPPEVVELAERFDRYVDAYTRGKYNETQVRREFVDPFFQALGWDVDNTQGYAEAYKEVVHEDAIRVGHATKAPDYGFRIGGVRKFFVEAKKPSVSIKEDTHPAYQLRRYAWSAKLPLSILTDFEEFAVYDCRIRPAKGDGPSTARTLYLTYQDYADRWDDIAGVFSRQAILTGSFDKYVESKKAKRGTAQVDTAFLEEIQCWRELLAGNIALRNAELSQRELNFAVQRTIDRIIFLRITEDRGIEPYGRLMALQNGTQVYARLCQLFHQADDRYNSGLFYFRPEKGRSDEGLDRLTTNLVIDDKVLKDIFQSLYYPDSPYEFSVLPADILGQVYEQFLGQVIRLTAGHRAKVEEKPEVKKAGGVYYTPTYIVDYIVEQTVGQLVAGKNPGPKGAVSNLKILDPACGSGSFLLGAYQFLLDWHLEAYQEEGNKWSQGRTPRIYQTVKDEWRLTTDERKRILLNNIYGVDIDAQAVEVTKLSLLLKVLEEESSQTLATQLMMFQERALPDLGNNIKCGNSLIGPDFYQGQQLALLDEEEQYRINVFDWMTEFPEIMKAGGFDAVIGNPPYLFITEIDEAAKQYYFEHYETAVYRFDVYGLFAEVSINKLARRGGYLSFIVPHTLLSNVSFEKLRRLMLNSTLLELIIDIGPGVFERARNETMIFVSRNNGVGRHRLTEVISTTVKAFPEPLKRFCVDQSTWLDNPTADWLVNVSPLQLAIVKKLETGPNKLGDICTINQGLRTGNNARYLSDKPLDGKWKPVVGGKHIGRYEPLGGGTFVLYEPDVLDAPRRKGIFESSEKLVVQEVRNITLPRRIVATYDDQQVYCLQSTNVINLRKPEADHWNLKYLLAVLNSRAANFFFRQCFSGNNHIASGQLARIPVPWTTCDSQDGLARLAERILELHQRMAAAHTPQAKTILKRQVEATDREIDSLVYRLYDLTEDEIRIVEGG